MLKVNLSLDEPRMRHWLKFMTSMAMTLSSNSGGMLLYPYTLTICKSNLTIEESYVNYGRRSLRHFDCVLCILLICEFWAVLPSVASLGC